MLNEVKSRLSRRNRGFQSGKKILLSLIVMALFSCGTEPETVSELTAVEAPDFFKLADSSATLLVQTLGGRLTEVFQSDGVIKAIDVCKEEAYEITDRIEDEIGKKVSIKRVSNKYRNPKNAPDKYEIEALTWFENQLILNNTLPKFYGQKILRKNKEIIRYYKPMVVKTKCLLCHGDAETRLPKVAKRINKYYPNDTAVDYQEGDFRGLIRVEMRGETL